MPSFRMILPVLLPSAMAALGAAQAADEPRGDAGRPGQTVERPFGGPPNRTLGQVGKRCATPSKTCVMSDQDKVGADCLCPGEGGQKVKGQVVQ
jgi:hypothetical protein